MQGSGCGVIMFISCITGVKIIIQYHHNEIVSFKTSDLQQLLFYGFQKAFAQNLLWYTFNLFPIIEFRSIQLKKMLIFRFLYKLFKKS
jgi:hypothetical protein